MPKFLISTLLVLFVSTAFAVEILQKEIACDKTETLLSYLKKEYKEKPIWLGLDPDSETNYVILVNTEKITWSIVQFNQDAACLLGSGQGNILLGPDPKAKSGTFKY